MKDTEKALQREELFLWQEEERKKLKQRITSLALLTRVEILELENLELRFRQSELEETKNGHS